MKLPPHRAISLEGIHAYVDSVSVKAGSNIKFFVSSSKHYTISVHPVSQEQQPALHVFPESAPFIQPIHPGSYIHVPCNIPGDTPYKEFSVECWVRPWNGTGLQGIITQFDQPNSGGFGLFLHDRVLCFYAGDGSLVREENFCKDSLHELQFREWYHVACVFNEGKVGIYINGKLSIESKVFSNAICVGTSVLRIGAYGINGEANGFLDADISMPIVYAKSLSSDEILDHFSKKGLAEPLVDSNLLGCWPLVEEKGCIAHDTSNYKRHGEIINCSTWMIGGPSFNSASVPRYGTDYDPTLDPLRGHAIRFASDDLYDCGWEATHEFKIPNSAVSGIYVARIESCTQKYEFCFVVCPCQSESPILVICATNCWRAYCTTPFPDAGVETPYTWKWSGIKNSDENAPSYSYYVDHKASQPCYQIGLNIPCPNSGPEVLYNELGNGYGQWVRNEKHLHFWLKEEHYSFDVVSDLDVHKNPRLLLDYQVVIVNGHSEYWSEESYKGIENFLANGGNLVVLSGNTMYWRASFDERMQVMECRKFDNSLGGSEYCNFGEIWHSQDGKKGSLMRECRLPAWHVIGLDTFGWAVAVPQDFGSYEVKEADHFLFKTPHNLGFGAGDRFGFAEGHESDPTYPHAVGHEWDVRVSTLRGFTVGIPEGAVIPDEPQGIVTLALGKRQNSGPVEVHTDYFGREIGFCKGVSAEMILWERHEGGGKVFNAGVVGFSWCLSEDRKLQLLMKNVLSYFLKK